MNNLEILVSDLKKASKIEEDLKQIRTIQAKSMTEEIISYALSREILCTAKDLFFVCSEIPQLKENLITMYDQYSKKLKDKLYEESISSDEYRYAGTYNSISEVPGYGTEFNDRCVPSGVVIRSNNKRC